MLSLTSELDVGVWSTTRSDSFTPRKVIRYPLYSKLVGPQGQSKRVWNLLSQPGFDPRTAQPVASRYTD